MSDSEIINAIKTEVAKLPHACTQESEISRITTLLGRIIKEFYGNGQKGIAREFPELRTAVENLTATVAAQTKVISDLLEFQASEESVHSYKDKLEQRNREKTKIWISIILGISSLGVSLIIALL